MNHLTDLCSFQDKAAEVRARNAERKRIYRASLTEEKKSEQRAKDAQRRSMERSLKKIAARVASTDFSEEEHPQVCYTFCHILPLSLT